MNTQLKSQIQNSKTRQIFGVEAFSRHYILEYIFDKEADYTTCYFINEETVTSYFGIPVYKKIREHDVINHFLFGIKIKSVSMEEIYFERYFKNINIDYDDAYILQGGSGEPFLWISYAAKLHFAKNNSKKPIVIGRRGSFASLVKMYLPGVIYLAKNVGVPDTEKPYVTFGNHKYFPRICAKTDLYLYFNQSVLPDLYIVFRHLSFAGVPVSDVTFPKPLISDDTKQRLAAKANNIDLNLDNFVILAPEANATFRPPAEFWSAVVKKFLNMGVDVFLNFINENHYIQGCKTLPAPLPYDEIYELALKAKAVISLRSGFPEIILPTQTPIIVVLTHFLIASYSPPRQDSISNHSINSLIKIPLVKEESVREVYYFEHETYEEAAEKVLYWYGEMVKNDASSEEVKS